MRTTNLFGRLACVISSPRTHRRRPRQHRRLTSRCGLSPSLEHLESRTLLASVSIEQLTSSISGINGLYTDISGDGATIAFESYRNLTGDNADGNREIVLYHAATGAFTQVTDTLQFGSSYPSINYDGTRVAFQSQDNLTGENPDGSQEIFLYDATTSSLRQVTDTIRQGSGGDPYVNQSPSIDGSGTKIAFASRADLTGSNADGNGEIFVYDAVASSFMQITDTVGETNYGPAINIDGTRIAYISDNGLVLFDSVTGGFTPVSQQTYPHEFAPAISGDGTKVAYSYGSYYSSEEIFVFDSTTGSTTRLSDVMGNTPSLNHDGTKIAFQSNLDLTFENPEGQLETFLLDTTTSNITQLSADVPFFEPSGFTFPSINSDGTKIAFSYDVETFGGEIYLFDVTTSGLTKVADDSFAVAYAPSITSDGGRIAFTYNLDLTGDNTDGNQEVFLVDSATGSFTQVTDSSGALISSGGTSTNGDGSLVVFESNADLIGSNVDGNSEIFLFDTVSGSLTQVTDTTSGGSSGPSLSDDGARIVFHSYADLTGNNADLNWEVFLLDMAEGSVTQVTDTTGLQNGGVINGDGTKIVINSTADLSGNNPDRNWELFLFDIAASSFTQVTDSVGAYTSSRSASISRDGAKIAFDSDADLTGQNADGAREVFLFDVTTSSTTQVTSTVRTTGISNVMERISGDGTRIAFQSNANLTGNNPDGNSEIFVFDLSTSTFTQITVTSLAGFLSSVSINGDGTKIAFTSPAHRPVETSELFLATIDYSVQDVHLFYNNSVHDGNGAVVTEADFDAIPADKDPLQFGRSGKFTSVSGYSRGINGLFIDVLDLPNDGAGIDASDFAFTVGTDDFPDTWAAAPAPTSVGVFPNAAPGGADRIYVTFADGAIVDTWLGITILATADTGLASDTTFFYGSVPGETGAAFAGQGEFFGRDAADLQAIAADIFHAASANNPNDVNRDGRVDAFDLQLIPVASGGGFNSNVLAAITPQAGPSPLAAAVLDEAVAAGDASAIETDGITFRPPHTGLGDSDGPAVERVGGEATMDRDRAFAMFADGKRETARTELLMTLAVDELRM